jgi:hypothetical protein
MTNSKKDRTKSEDKKSENITDSRESKKVNIIALLSIVLAIIIPLSVLLVEIFTQLNILEYRFEKSEEKLEQVFNNILEMDRNEFFQDLMLTFLGNYAQGEPSTWIGISPDHIYTSQTPEGILSHDDTWPETDVLFIGANQKVVRYLLELGYSVYVSNEIPSDTNKYNLIYCSTGGVGYSFYTDDNVRLRLQAHIENGGSLFLTAGIPYFLNMPFYLGASCYGNIWGYDKQIKITTADPINHNIKPDSVIYEMTGYMDGGATLRGLTSAIVLAQFDTGEPAITLNIYGNGGTRIVWSTVGGCPINDGEVNRTYPEYEAFLKEMYDYLVNH